MSGSAWIVLGIALAAIAIAGLRSQRDLRRWLGSVPHRARRWSRSALLAATLVTTALALDGASSQPPPLGGSSIDAVLVVDVSRSMGTRDTPPSRLRRALHFAHRFLERAGGTRIGLVLFAGDAFVALPLTLDRDALDAYLLGIDTELITHRGSDLGRALRAASRVFDPGSSRPRAALLLSDGEHAGPGLEEVLQDLRSLQVHVSTVGFGTPGGGLVPGRGADPLRDSRAEPVRSRRVDSILERIAEETGGRFLLDGAPPAPEDLVPPAPDPVERDQPSPIPYLALLAVLALTVEMLLSSRTSRTTPATSTATMAVVALLLVAAGPSGWLVEGDAMLARGEAREALSLYRRIERTSGASPSTQIRIGSALYRLGKLSAASGAFLEALRHLEGEDLEARFVAAFNLGTALLAQERYREARDALWAALVARPDSLETKFNYEWALERLPPQDEPVAGSPREADPSSDGEAGESGQPTSGEVDRERAEQRLTQEEAERWLRSLDENPIEPLRRQIASELEGRGRSGGQAW
ncbi:MAG: VWA domain-containing protein [Myxococcota bacterium]